jgi:hypothetical protein
MTCAPSSRVAAGGGEGRFPSFGREGGREEGGPPFLSPPLGLKPPPPHSFVFSQSAAGFQLLPLRLLLLQLPLPLFLPSPPSSSPPSIFLLLHHRSHYFPTLTPSLPSQDVPPPLTVWGWRKGTRNFHPGLQVWAPWLPLYVISRREGGRQGGREGEWEEEGGREEWEEVEGEAMISV